MRKVILASHGDLAKGAKSSLEMIMGDCDRLTVYSMYPGDSAADYALELERAIQTEADDEFVIVTDLYGASVCNALYALTRYPNVWLFSGFNLQFLLELLFDYEAPLTDADVEKLLESARGGLRQVAYQRVENTQVEEF